MLVSVLIWFLVGSIVLNLLWAERSIGSFKRVSLSWGFLGIILGPIALMVWKTRTSRAFRYLAFGDFRTTKMEFAEQFAKQIHIKQVRKYTGEPYSNHPITVAEIVSHYTHSESAIVAAYLHDAIEDTEISYMKILEIFGKEVADLVLEVTNPKSELPMTRAFKTELVVQQFKGSSKFAKIIKMADILHNISNIARLDPGFAEIYLAEKETLLPVLKEGCPKLYMKVMSAVDANKEILRRAKMVNVSDKAA